MIYRSRGPQAPLVSIVTVTYNCAEVVGDALRSVACQRLNGIEHIVIDGASTDGTLDVIRRHGPHVARLVSEPDHGIYDAMNKGLALATGDWVGFLNADDMLAGPDALERLLAETAHDSAPSADLIYGDLVYVDQSDTSKIIRYWKSGDFAPSRLRFGWMPPHPTFYARRELIQRVGRFDTQLRIAADYDFVLRCLMQPGIRVRYVPEVLVRMRTGGVSNRSWRALSRKSREDLIAIRRSGLGGWFTLGCKNLRKIPQWFSRPATSTNGFG